jgi:hypothetical protein
MLETSLLLLFGYAMAVAGQAQELPSPPDIGTIIQQLAGDFAADASLVVGAINSTVINLSRLAYVSALLVGVFLYSTHLEKRLGKDLVKGGLLLAFLSEFIFPLISKV